MTDSGYRVASRPRRTSDTHGWHPAPGPCLADCPVTWGKRTGPIEAGLKRREPRDQTGPNLRSERLGRALGVPSMSPVNGRSCINDLQRLLDRPAVLGIRTPDVTTQELRSVSWGGERGIGQSARCPSSHVRYPRASRGGPGGTSLVGLVLGAVPFCSLDPSSRSYSTETSSGCSSSRFSRICRLASLTGFSNSG
jgi:hypothetical protein